MVLENLGPAETILQTLLTYSDHMVHNRPGMVVTDAGTATKVRWIPVTHREEDGQKVVYQLRSVRNRTQRSRAGVLQDDGRILDGGRVVGRYQRPGLFAEVAAWMYKQIADVYELDNEFAARWASFAYAQEHRDLKVALAAFMLVQSRKGDPVREGGEVLFFDEDYRDVGEAMILLYDKKKKDLNPKMILRVHDLLSLDPIAQINRDLGFGRSARAPFYGRWSKAVEKWLAYREDNVQLLEGLVKAGYRTTVMELARRSRYKPKTDKFFELLRWKQKQSKAGHRDLAIGEDVAAAQTWDDLTEREICERIEEEKPGYKRIVGMLPKSIGLTRAILAVAIEAGSLSDKDLVILTPTLEALGMLEIPELKSRWASAVKAAEDMRAANIAKRVKSQEAKAQLEEAAEDVLKTAVEEVARNIRVYFMVDISGSMENAIEQAKAYVAKFLPAFPAERLHISVFNTMGREVELKHHSQSGVEHAFRGIRAGGGTDYGAGVRALAEHKPAEDEDVLFIFIGDEQASPFDNAVVQAGLRPMAFGLVQVQSQWGVGNCVQQTAARLGIPCFMIDEATFEDPYAIPRTVRDLVASTPVGQVAAGARREALVDRIMKTELLKKPAWAE
ncbi:MAG: vWA domain-containing protein [Deltaproteobacteria bacterium]|jgi:Mg-chelatase subunit ChlD